MSRSRLGLRCRPAGLPDGVRQIDPWALAPPLVSDEALEGLKFAEALPDDLARLVLASRVGDTAGARAVVTEARRGLVVR